MRSNHSPQTVVGPPLSLKLDRAFPDQSIACEGWILKKRRKKMQGFARRYFMLYNSGLLSYAFEPGQPARDHLYLHNAAISTAPGRKDIHIDSNTATFHLKCLSTDDFNTWMVAFRKFISLGQEARKSASLRNTPRLGGVSVNKSALIAEDMGITLAELEASVHSLGKERPMRHSSFGKKSEKEKNKDHTKDGMFGLFKKPSQLTPPQEYSGDNHGSVGSSSDLLPSALEQVKSALSVLKAQHAMLLKSLQFLVYEPNQSVHSPQLPVTTEEEELGEAVDYTPRLSTPITRKSNRNSIATTVSDTVHEWFDALDDGPEEFLMDVQLTLEQTSRVPTNDSQSSLEPSNASIDTDIEEETTKSPSHVKSGRGGQIIVRRTRLPSPVVGDEGSLFSILKKNVGKDLSTITFPVTFNEPLTLLQRVAEEVEYFELLNQAVSSQDPIDRICYVAAFAISGYTHTRHRSGRKGFNPMLAETFEDVRFNFIAEKVRHNPLEIAYHAHGENWELSATSSGRTKFWGKSLEIIPLGSTRLRIGSDTYIWNKPSSFMRNLMVGTKYFEHNGNMTIENTETQLRCAIEFKQSGYWGPSNIISGVVESSSGEVLGRLEGKWDDQITRALDSEHFHVLWRMTPFPKNALDFYGFTSFGITLNEITEDLVQKLPPTDSRHRPDVRALEEGELDVAEEQKQRVEELQRERRRQGRDREPRWFRQVGNSWEYKGGYWEARAQGWKSEGVQPLW